MKIAYCGHDFFHGCLRQLLSHDYNVAKVFTVDTNNRDNFNQYILETCAKHQIPYTLSPMNAADVDSLQQQGFDLVISAAYNFRIPDLSSTSIKGINIHPSLLPMGRGVWPLPWTILRKHKTSGVTLHKISPQWDAGDILLQQSFDIDSDEILESLSVKCQLLAESMILQLLQNLNQHWETAQRQNQGVYWPRPSRQDRTLDWDKTIDEIERTCRAFGKFGCFARFNQQDWLVYSLKAWTQSHDYPIGQVIHKTNTEMVVAAKDGLVSLLYFGPCE